MKKLLFILILIFPIIFMSCIHNNDNNSYFIDNNHLPDGATDIEELGNNWVEFSFQGKRFLYEYSYPYNGFGAITQIN